MTRSLSPSAPLARLDTVPAGSPRGNEPQRLVGVGGTRIFCFELPDSGRVTIGRSSEADLLLLHPTVSRIHAGIGVDEAVSVEDLGSMNGTRLEGARLAQGAPHVLSAGALLEIGSVTFLLQRQRGQLSQDLEESQREVNASWQVERLATTYCDLAADLLGVERPRISRQALGALEDYPWGTGSAEIKGVLYRAVLVSRGDELRVEHLRLTEKRRPAAANCNETPTTQEDLGSDVEVVERERLQEALARSGGNSRLAARSLGMPQGVFRRRAVACGLVGLDDPSAG